VPSRGRVCAVKNRALRRRGARWKRPSDPHLAGHNLSSVAFDVGFGDLSYFNRALRQRYAATPMEIRQSAIRADPPLSDMLKSASREWLASTSGTEWTWQSP
jgi:AraC-like DNA-binding protein